MTSLQDTKSIFKTKVLCFLVLFVFFIAGAESLFSQRKIYTVVLDAGHGGRDPGNLGSGFKEKDIALKVTLAVGKILSKNKDIRVVYTRTKDNFVELWKRGDIANDVKADLFVSFHCDSHTSQAYGLGTFVLGANGNKTNLEIAKRENSVILLEKDYKQNYDYDPNSPASIIGLSLLQEENLEQSLQLASLIQTQMVKKLKRHNREVKMGNFQVLRETIMPSVLVELGFLTNKKEGRYLNSRSGQQALAKTAAETIVTYVNQLKLNTVSQTNTRVVAPVNTDKTIKATSNITFKVQIASSKKNIETKSYNFKRLKNVERVKVGAYYKYYYGNTSDYSKIKTFLNEAKKVGYRSAFITAFKNGEKISVKEALKTP